MNLEQKLEAVLFYKNEPMEVEKLAKILDVGEREIKEALENLSKSLSGRGICLIMNEREVSLITAPEVKDLIYKLAKDEMSSEIGRAGLETLAIILYNGPISRRELDYIRGVNSTFILRNLCIRGLVERETNPKDQRTFKYKGTLETLAHLGLKSKTELPEFNIFRNKFEELRDNQENGGE